LIFEVAGFKQILRRNTEVMAQVIGANSEAALRFKDKEAGKEFLGALKAEPYVLSACLYSEGQVLATYYREGAQRQLPPPSKGDGFSFEKDTLNLYHSVRYDGDVIGTVFIQSDLRVVSDRLKTYYGHYRGGDALGHDGRVPPVAPVAAIHFRANFASRRNRQQSRATEKLFHPRGQIFFDEMGQLIDRFNEMLAGIQERDAALLRAQNGLEKRVDERTKELQLEIRERSRVESELRESQLKFETLVNSIEGVVWEADPKSFEFTFVSQQAGETARLRPERMDCGPGFLAGPHLYGRPGARAWPADEGASAGEAHADRISHGGRGRADRLDSRNQHFHFRKRRAPGSARRAF
jgi:PAS domain-containing protein